MKKYKAKVVGLKWSPKHMSKYRPVFEYTDECGETRKYVRRKSMERTPFTEERQYTIIRHKGKTYESTEKKLSNKFCFACFKIVTLLAALTIPSFALFILLLSTMSTVAFYIGPNFIKNQIGKCRLKTEKIEGKITGYQKLKRRDKDGTPLYRPIIEYNYGNKIYTHMSKTLCKVDQYGYLSVCEIFVCKSRKTVLDIFEVSEPIFNVEKIRNFAKSMCSINKDKDIKIYEPRKTTITSTCKTNTMPINIPLKTLPYKKASGWY